MERLKRPRYARSTRFSGRRAPASVTAIFLGVTFISFAVNTGRMHTATTSDATSTMITVFGRKPMNWPMMPVQNTRGRNAATVVAVEANTAMAISCVPRIDAVTKSAPSSTCR